MGDEHLNQLADELGGQHYLIRWLAKEDSSAYGECMGADYDRLLKYGLVIEPTMPLSPRDIAYARVSLTPKGLALNAVLREREIIEKGKPHG